MYNYLLNLKEIRESKGISQKKLAKVLNVPQQQISRYEQCKHEITLSRLVQIAEVLGVTLDELVEFKRLHQDYSLELNDKLLGGKK